MRDAIRRLKDGVWYECRPVASGVFYIFWSEQRRSRRESTGAKEVATAAAYFDEWLALRGAALSKTTRISELWAEKYGDQNASLWRNLEPTFGGLLPAEVTQAIVDRYVAGRTSGRISAKGKKATPGSARLELVCLLAAIRHGAGRRVGLVAADDVPGVDLPPKAKPRERWLTDDEINALIGAAQEMRGEKEDVDVRVLQQGRPEHEFPPPSLSRGVQARLSRVERFLWIGLDACARRTAIQELRWDTGQVDFERRVIDFLPPGREQTRKRRATVAMSNRLFLVLQRAYAERTGPYVLDHPGNINRELTALAARAGVPRVTPHVLRHTAATQMSRRGVPLYVVAKLLGDTLATVESVYAKWQPEWGRDAVEMTGGRDMGAAPNLRVIQDPR